MTYLQVFCQWAHEAYPGAKLYGSSRHTRKQPELPWQKALLDDPATLAEFKDDLDLRIPAGVDFISSNENVHFSSVVAYHPATQTIHVRSHHFKARAMDILSCLRHMSSCWCPAVPLYPTPSSSHSTAM